MTDHQKSVAERMEKIARRNKGILTPDAVLEDAKSEDSPLHCQFEWDDTQAAQQWRLEQARALIRSVRVDIKTESRVISTVRYVRNPQAVGAEQGYADVMKIRTSEDLSREALRREFAAAKALFDRCESLADAFDMRDDVAELRERVVEMDHRLEEPAMA